MKQIQIDVGLTQYIVNKDGTIEDQDFNLVGLSKKSTGKKKFTFHEFWLHPLLGIQMYPIIEHPTGVQLTLSRINKTKVLGVGSKPNRK